jgi:hypothetical protein
MDKPQVIFTIFAGRKKNLEILLRYTDALHKSDDIHEVHLWNFTRDKNDETWLKGNDVSSRAYTRVMHVKNKSQWHEYYNYYTTDKYPNHIIVKCDDDIVFIDVDEFPKFIARRCVDKDSILAFPSIINNVRAGLYQQEAGIHPESIANMKVTIRDFLNISTWGSGSYATKLHNFFLNDVKTWLEKSKQVNPWFINHPKEQRFSINFFAILSKDLHIYQDMMKISNDDENNLTAVIPLKLKRGHYVDMHFTVSHLAFFKQRGRQLDEGKLQKQYMALADDVLKAK